MKIRTGWRKKYGLERKRQIKDYRQERERALEIINTHGPVTAEELESKHGFAKGKAGKILLDLERSGLHKPPEKRALSTGQKPGSILRRQNLKTLLDNGAQISNILTLPQYSGVNGQQLLRRDLEGIRKYWNAEYSLHKQDPITPKVKKLGEFITQDPRASTQDIANFFKVGVTAIRRWLSEVPQHIKDLRIYPGNRYSVGELRKQNITILVEYLKGTKLDDIAKLLNDDLRKHGLNASLNRLDISERLRWGANKDKQLVRTRPSGTTTFSLAELSQQNRLIVDLVARGLRPTAISKEIEKNLRQVVTPDQVDARLRYWKKRDQNRK